MIPETPTQKTLKLGPAVLVSIFLLSASLGLAQSADTTAQTHTAQASTDTPATSNLTRAQRRAARRRARAATQQQSGQTSPSSTTQVGPTAAQRSRDAQILAAQKAQSAATASENDALTQKVIQDQKKQQAEPRVQDAPGPGSQPLPGDPAIQPAPSLDPPRIQDAPGPAQTLPKAPPTPAPQS